MSECNRAAVGAGRDSDEVPNAKDDGGMATEMMEEAALEDSAVPLSYRRP